MLLKNFVKGIINPQNQFYIILIYLSSPRSIFKKLQYIFCRKLQIIGHNKNAILFTEFLFCFYKLYSYQKYL